MANDGDDRVICPKCGADAGPTQPQLETAVIKCPACGAWIDSKGRHIANIYEHFKAQRERRRREDAAIKDSSRTRGQKKTWKAPARKVVKDATE
jgi:DNA-directed RNA polymerase subunit RPC12/RpoP